MTVEFPYIPDDRVILYVGKDNQFMQAAAEMWAESGCIKWPTGAVVVENGEIIGRGNNNAEVRPDICPRDVAGFKTGEGYQLCKDVCHQVGGHSEVNSVDNALTNGRDTAGADLYLFGHWWCCKGCWDKMIENGIRNVYLLEGADPETNWRAQSELVLGKSK